LSTSDLDSTNKNFFFVRRNGLGPLRLGSESQAKDFYDYSRSLTYSYESKFRIIMIVGLIILFLSQLILIPIVFSVQRMNNKVLSLFGYIPLNEISELASKCERFIQKYLEDYQDKRENSLEKSDPEIENSTRREHNENTYFEVNPNESMNPENIKLNISEGEGLEAKVAQLNRELANQQGNLLLNSPNSEMPGKSQEMKPEEEDKSLLKPSNENKDAGKQKTTTKEEEKKNNDDDVDIVNDRTQKLLNSKDNNKRGVVVQFIIVTSLFVLWFVINFVDITLVLKRFRLSMDHLHLLIQRTPDVRYAFEFAFEELAENDLNKVYLYDRKLIFD
jgi:hypothetical protein